jgi:hypothetical protein
LPGWAWDPVADKWEEGFRRLVDYVKHHDDARVASSHTVDGYKLGSWVKLQRRTFAKGLLDADRQNRLEELPGWTWDPRAAKWEEGFSRLQRYVERHGDARVPSSYTLDGYKVGGWVSEQRSAFAKGSLEPDRQNRLQELPGWTWDTIADKWKEGFDRLLYYVQHRGDARVPRDYIVDGYQLGSWAKTQRDRYFKGVLELDRQRRLEQLPGWVWSTRRHRRRPGRLMSPAIL